MVDGVSVACDGLDMKKTVGKEAKGCAGNGGFVVWWVRC